MSYARQLAELYSLLARPSPAATPADRPPSGSSISSANRSLHGNLRCGLVGHCSVTEILRLCHSGAVRRVRVEAACLIIGSCTSAGGAVQSPGQPLPSSKLWDRPPRVLVQSVGRTGYFTVIRASAQLRDGGSRKALGSVAPGWVRGLPYMSQCRLHDQWPTHLSCWSYGNHLAGLFQQNAGADGAGTCSFPLNRA